MSCIICTGFLFARQNACQNHNFYALLFIDTHGGGHASNYCNHGAGTRCHHLSMYAGIYQIPASKTL